MAYLVGTLQTAKQASGTTYTVNFPSGVAANDLLLVLLSQDGSTESLAVASSGFTALGGTQTESGACSSLWFYKIAAGGETSATFACASDDIIGTTMLWRDAHATAPFGATPTSGVNFVRTDWNAVASSASGALTPPEDDCTLVYAWCIDGGAAMRTQLSQCVNIDTFGDSQIGHIIGYRQQGTAAAAPTVTMYATTAAEGGNGWVLAIRNKSGGALATTVLAGTNEIEWYGNWSDVGGTTADTLVPADWTALSGFAASINGINTATTIGAGASTNSVSNTTGFPANVTSWGSYTRISMTDNTAGNWSGGRHPITAIDLTGKIVSVQLALDVVTSARFGSKGFAIVFGDAGGNWVAYQLAERTGIVGGLGYTFHVAPGQGTALDSSGTIATTLTAVTQVGYMVHRIGSSASSNILSVWNLTVSDVATITGGGSADAALAKFSSMSLPFKRFTFGDMNLLQASAQTMAKTAVQIGDGDTPTYFDATASSFEFPPTYSATYGVANTQNIWNVTANDVGLIIKAAAGDTINMTAAVIATVTEQPLTIHADCNVAAVSFAGSSIVGYTVTDNAGLSWSGATFKSGGTVTIAGGGDLTNCSITRTTSTNTALAVTADGSVITGTTISGAGAAYALELGTAVTAITLTDCTLTAGSTDKVIIKLPDTTVAATAMVAGTVYEVKTKGTTVWTSFGATSNAVTLQDTGDTATWTSHTLENGDVVYFSAITTTTGISVDTVYYVVNKAANTFQVAATRGGAALPLTTDGSGTVVVGKFEATGVGTGTGDAYKGVKITIDGTTSLTLADVTKDTGCTNTPVKIAAPQPTLSATGLANTRYVLWNRTTSAELDNTFVAGTAYSKVIASGASSGDVLDLYAFKEGYAEARATIIYSGDDATFAVEQAVDTSIDYYRTAESITDYTTLTEYNFYAPDIYIQADDADGENKLARLFIFYNGALTTEDGARYMRGGITFNSPFDVVINRSVRAIAVDNVSVTYGLHFTDEDTIRVTTDDGTSWIAPPSAPGSIRYAFGVSPGQIETGVSGVTAQDIVDIADAAAAAVVADGKTLTVPKFLGLK